MNLKPTFYSPPVASSADWMVMCLALLLSCAPAGTTTQITGSWKDPAAGNYKDFFVIVMTKNLPARTTLENDITSRLTKQGVKAAPSLDIFAHSEKPDTPEERNAAVEKIQSLGHEAILTVSLKKKTEEGRYVPGQVQYAPTNIGYGSGYNNQLYGSAAGAGYYGTFGGYYNYNYQTSATPGYYETDKTYFIESNLYDSKSAKLMWSAQSATFNPLNIDVASADFSKIMVNAMIAANLLFKKEKGKK